MQSVYSAFIRSLSVAPDKVTLSSMELANVDINITVAKSNLAYKVYHYATNFFILAATGCVIAGYGCIYLIYSLVTHPFISIASKIETRNDFNFSNIEKTVAKYLPNFFGYSTSTFQDCGLGTRFLCPMMKGVSGWDDFLKPENIKGIEREEDFHQFFVNYLETPNDIQAFADLLLAQGCTSFRLSLERSVIQANPNKPYEQDVIEKYRTLFIALKQRGIEPLVTLHHFVDPKWFQDMGRFNDKENIEGFVQFSLDMMQTFNDEVTHWMTFNEPSIYVFQTYIRKKYPTRIGDSISMAGNVLRNVLIAHMRIYKRAKQLFPEKQIGFTHQWLKFVPFNENNPLERITCEILSHVTYRAVYDFFRPSKDGKHRFSFSFPGFCKNELEVTDEEGTGFMDFTGVQHYGYPVMKIGFNYGSSFPGSSDAVTNLTIPFLKCGLTFGATSFEEGTVASFGPPYDPQSLMDALIEASHFAKPVMITETGFDRSVFHEGSDVEEDPNLQRKAYEAIACIAALANPEVEREDEWDLTRFVTHLTHDSRNTLSATIQRFKEARENIRLIGVQYWTLLARQLEWDNGHMVHLSALEHIQLTPITHRIEAVTQSPASIFVQKVGGAMREKMDQKELA